jgi:GMP synthase-like glutamine amidotransferase
MITRMKKLLIIQHEDLTTAGTTLDWAKERNLEVHTWWPATEAAPQKLECFVGVVICGGTMDTFEEDKFPWLKNEKQFLQEALKAKTKMFGLCLGAQLLAEALGGKVYYHHGWEIGFVQIENPATKENIAVFHWHHCTFDLPSKAELFFTNDYCKNQAFKLQDQVIATQFHPEATLGWVKDCAEELEPRHTGRVQTREQMLAGTAQRDQMQAWYFQQLDHLFLGF